MLTNIRANVSGGLSRRTAEDGRDCTSPPGEVGARVLLPHGAVFHLALVLRAASQSDVGPSL